MYCRKDPIIAILIATLLFVVMSFRTTEVSSPSKKEEYAPITYSHLTEYVGDIDGCLVYYVKILKNDVPEYSGLVYNCNKGESHE